MATTTINGIRLDYPDDPCMIFNPCLFKLTGTLARTRVYVSHGGEYYTATYQTPNGGTLDLCQFMQSFFTGLDMGKDLEGISDIKVSELGKTVNITLFALDTDGTTLAQFNVSVFSVWGALAINENWDGLREITWFKNFPLTVTIYAPNNGNIIVGEEAAVSIPSTPSLVNVVIDTDDDEFSVMRTYMRQGHAVSVDEYSIKTDDHDEGVYLRWVDRHGYWRYWLFKPGDPTRQAASKFGTWYHNDYDYYSVFNAGNVDNGGEGWQGGAGRRQSFSRNDVQPLCAPLVDQATFDMLQDVTTSPCVDMFLGYNGATPRWTAVTVEPGSYTKDVKKPEQDFLLNLVLPETPVQTL